jgi:hypothetical protein
MNGQRNCIREKRNYLNAKFILTKGIIGKDYEKADRVSGSIGGFADHAHAAAKEI